MSKTITSPDAQQGEAANGFQPIGAWTGPADSVQYGITDPEIIADSVRRPTHIVFNRELQSVGIAFGGEISGPNSGTAEKCLPLLASLPAFYPEWLGDRSFLETHRLRFAYVGGAMARGINSTKIVIELARIGAMGFFGAAGMRIKAIEESIDEMSEALDPEDLSWGSNLIHSPNDPEAEEAVVDLYLRRGVRRVSASAYMGLTKHVVRYACTGLYRDSSGAVCRRNYLFAKISREEVARHFLSPPPEKLLAELVAEGALSGEEAELARRLPLSEDIIVESDSGGHTDNRPLNALFPTIRMQCDRISREQGYSRPIRLGAAGSLGTPASVAGAFGLGASFVLLGSVHQAAIESGISDDSRRMLAQADIADVMMTPSADMFEFGVKVQVLRRGTMMGPRGLKLYDIYSRFDSIEAIPVETRESIEKQIFRMPLNEVWEKTVQFFKVVDPKTIDEALNNPKQKMALIFRWYLGNSSRWPIIGDKERIPDYQIWCGPAMGAFNRWVAGSFLEPPENRTVQQIALNLMEGAAIVTRACQLRSFGAAIGGNAFDVRPTELRL